MSKNFLRYIAATLAVLSLVSMLSACGTNEAEPTNAPTEVQSTEPPATDAPATEAPATEPPATEPPATEPPATEPPATEPPATEPPATEPPVTEPPATEPPAPQNEIGKPISNDGVTVKVTNVVREGNQITVTVELTYAGEESVHNLMGGSRFFLVDSNNRPLAVTDIQDANGNSIMSGSVANGETITITAIFNLTDKFAEPVAYFRYVYNNYDFRKLQVKL